MIQLISVPCKFFSGQEFQREKLVFSGTGPLEFPTIARDGVL